MIDDKDTHVVELDFNNKKFEKNVSQSMSTLDKLKKKFSFKGIENSINTVSASISNLEVVSITAIQNITNRVVNLGIQRIKSLTVDNLSRGWTKFGQKTTSVATMAAQNLKVAGKELTNYSEKMEVINEQLEKLNWFSDETSYTFTDMVDNIGKFTAAGQDLDSSVKAMEGIATWAALSGQNATTASRAMYQLAQAIGKGKIQLIDWKSIQNANMDTQEFRQTVLDTAVAMGQLTKAGQNYITKTGKKFTKNQFTEALDTGWFTSDVLRKTLDKYSAAIDQIYEISEKEGLTAAEVIEKYGDQLDAFSVKAFKAAQEARTFTDVLNATIDAVSSKWRKTFEILVGGYDDAKKLWSNLADEFYDAFAESGNFRNSILEQWKNLEGRADLFAHTGDENQGAFWNIFDSIKAVVGAVKDAWNDIFPKTVFKDAKDQAKDLGNQFKTFTARLQAFTKKMKPSEETLSRIRGILNGVFSVLKFGINLIKIAAALISPLLTLTVKGIQAISSILSSLGQKFAAFIEKTQYKFGNFIDEIQSSEKVFNAVNKVISTIGKAFSKFANIITSKVIPAFRNLVGKLGSVLSSFKDKIANLISFSWNSGSDTFNTKEISKQSRRISNAANNVNEATNEVSNSIEKTQSKTESLLEKIQNGFGSIGQKISDVFHRLAESLSPLGKLVKSFGSAIKSVLSATIDLLTVAFSLLSKGFEKVKQFFIRVADRVSDIHDTLKTNPKVFKKTTESVEDVSTSIDGISKSTDKLNDKASKISGNLKGMLAIVITIGVTITALSLVIRGITQTITYAAKPLSEIADSLSGYLDKAAMKIALDGVSSMVKSLALLSISLGVLIAAFKDTGMDRKQFGAISGILAGFLVTIGGIAIALTAINSKVKNVEKQVSTFSNKSSYILNKAKGLQIKLNKVGSIANSFEKSMQLKAIASIINAIGNTMLKITISRKVIAGRSLSDVVKGASVTFAFVALLGALGVAMEALASGKEGGKIRKGYVSMLGMASLILAFTKACQKLSDIQAGPLWSAAGTILARIAAIGAIVIALAGISAHETKLVSKARGVNKETILARKGVSDLTKNLGLILLGFSALLISFSKSRQVIVRLSAGEGGWTKVWISFGRISALLGEISVLGFVLSLGDKRNLENLSKVITAFGVAMLMLTASIAIMNKMSPAKSLVSIGLISGMLIGLAAACHVVQKKDAKAAKGISRFALALSLALFNLSISIAILNQLDFSESGRSVLLLTALITEMVVACQIAKNNANGNLKGAAIFFASMSASLLLLVGCIAIMQLIDFKSALLGTGVISAIILSLSVLMKQMSKVSSSGDSSAKAFVKIALSFTLICGALIGLVASRKLIENIQWQNLVSVGGMLTAVILSLSLVMNEIGNTAKKIGDKTSAIKNIYAMRGAFTILTANVVALIASMKLLSGVSWSNILSVTVPLVSVLITLCGSLEEIAKIKIPKGSSLKNLYAMMGAFTILTANAVGLVASMKLLSGIPWQSLLAITVPLVSMLVAMTGVIAILIKLSNSMSSATKLVAAVGSRTAISLSLLVFAEAVKQLAAVPWKSRLIAAGVLVSVLALFAGIVALISASGGTGLIGVAGLVVFSASLLVAASARLVFSSAILVFSKAMEAMQELNIGKMFVDILAIAGAFTALALVSVVIMAAIPAILALSAALTLIGIGILTASMGIEALTTNLVPFCTTVTENIETIAESLSELSIAITDALVSGLQNAMEQIHGLITTFINNLMEDGDSIYALLKDWIPKIIDLVNDLVKGILKLINENAKDLIDTVFNVLELLLSALDEHIPSMRTKVLSIIIKVINLLTANAPKLVKSLINFLVARINALIKNIGKLVKVIVQMVLKVTGMIFQMAGTLVGTLLKDRIIFLAALCKMIPEALEGIAYVFKETIKTCIGKILKFIGDVLDNIWSDLINSIKYLLGKLWNGIVEGIASIFRGNWVGDKVADWMEKNRKADITDQEKLIDAWASGDGITAAARTATNNISKTMKDMNDDLSKSTKEGVDAVQNAFNSAFGNDNSYDVNVNPVVDDSKIQSQLDDVSGDIDVSSDSSYDNTQSVSKNMRSSNRNSSDYGSTSNTYSSTNTYQPVFNVYGVDDPKTFAQQVNIELSKRQKGGKLAHGS
nr:MAG TPA: tail tape measure [Caudoviricetes sp.]